VVGGAFLYLIIHFPTIIKDKNFPKFSSFLSKKEIIKIFSISMPRTIGIFSFALILTYIMSKLSTIGDGYITFFN
jgi:Na+-driven multidrug efflux pump